MASEKGLYYRIIRKIVGRPKYLYGSQIKDIFETLPFFLSENERVDGNEFVFSMRWVLADLFGGGCEAEESEGEDVFAFLQTA